MKTTPLTVGSLFSGAGGLCGNGVIRGMDAWVGRRLMAAFNETERTVDTTTQDTAIPVKFRHWARWLAPVLDEAAGVLDELAVTLGRPCDVLDPFAGTGERTAAHPSFKRHNWVGLELQGEWIKHPWVRQGNALTTGFPDNSFDAIVTSLVFPNRGTDVFVSAPENPSHYNTYAHCLRDTVGDRTAQLHPQNAGGMKLEDWRLLHLAWAREARRVLRPGGLALIEMKNHRKLGVVHDNVEWIERQCLRIAGFEVLGRSWIEAPGNREGSEESRDERETHTALIYAAVPAGG